MRLGPGTFQTADLNRFIIAFYGSHHFLCLFLTHFIGLEPQPLQRGTPLPHFLHSFIYTQNQPLSTVHCAILFSISTETGSTYRWSSHYTRKGHTEPQGDTIFTRILHGPQHRGIRSDFIILRPVVVSRSMVCSRHYVRPPLSAKASQMQ